MSKQTDPVIGGNAAALGTGSCRVAGSAATRGETGDEARVLERERGVR